jgi:tetratricopeptide (TPR) repeat protein
MSALSLSANAFVQGDWARSREYLDRAEAIIHSIGTTRLSPWPAGARGWLALREGNLEEAARCGEETLRLAESVGDLDFARLAQRLLAERDLLEGRPETALARLQPLLEGDERKDDPGFLRTLARTYLALGNESEARHAAIASVARAAAQRSPIELVESLVTQGVVLEQHTESAREAEQIFAYAVARARRIPFPFGEALALRESGLLRAHRGEAMQAQELLTEAHAIFKRLGARREAEQTEQVMKCFVRS